MMRTLIVTAALAALVTTATAASATARNPKPGDYAQSSKVYAEYIANCRVERNTRPDLRDEAARKLEKLSRAQIELQIKGCQMSLPKPAAQRQAAKVPPAAYVGAGVAAGVVLARSLRRGGHQHEQGRLSEVELKNLEGLAQKALGPVPADARDYTTHVTRRVGAPAPGCVKGPDARPGRGTFVRWRCPPGTIKRLGW